MSTISLFTTTLEKMPISKMYRTLVYSRSVDEFVGEGVTGRSKHDVVLGTLVGEGHCGNDVGTEIDKQQRDRSETERCIDDYVDDKSHHFRPQMSDRIGDRLLKIVEYQTTCFIKHSTTIRNQLKVFNHTVPVQNCMYSVVSLQHNF